MLADAYIEVYEWSDGHGKRVAEKRWCIALLEGHQQAPIPSLEDVLLFKDEKDILGNGFSPFRVIERVFMYFGEPDASQTRTDDPNVGTPFQKVWLYVRRLTADEYDSQTARPSGPG